MSRLTAAFRAWRARRAPTIPGNYSQLSRDNLDADVAKAIYTVEDIKTRMAGYGLRPGETSFLELGPGTDFGAPVILSDELASVTVADRFIHRWNPDYHPEFYRRLRDRHGGSKRSLDAVIDAAGYPDEILRVLEEPAENLKSIASQSIHCVYSRAVFEHFLDIGAAAKEIGRICAAGAFNFHWIDFRDHDDFAHPLEHLLLPPAQWLRACARFHCERGSQKRLSEYVHCFDEAGLSIEAQEATLVVDDAYYRDFLGRLRSSRSAYRNWPADDLSTIGAFFVLKR